LVVDATKEKSILVWWPQVTILIKPNGNFVEIKVNSFGSGSTQRYKFGTIVKKFNLEMLKNLI